MDSGLLSTSPMARRINGERCMLFGWTRAILMQLAHPLVAAGVAEHSTFRNGPVAAAQRLHHTVRTMLALTFGDASGQRTALETIAAIHRRVHGELREAVGIFPSGTRYSAEDPALVLWVYVTLIDSVLLVYPRLVAPLSKTEQDDYCDDAAALAIALGAESRRVPRSADGIREAARCVLESGSLAVGGDARALVDAVLRPPFAWLGGPVAAINRRLTIGLLPDSLRAAYGFEWSARDERRYRRDVSRIRWLRRRMPDRLALWPEARSEAKGQADLR